MTSDQCFNILWYGGLIKISIGRVVLSVPIDRSQFYTISYGEISIE